MTRRKMCVRSNILNVVQTMLNDVEISLLRFFVSTFECAINKPILKIVRWGIPGAYEEISSLVSSESKYLYKCAPKRELTRKRRNRGMHEEQEEEKSWWRRVETENWKFIRKFRRLFVGFRQQMLRWWNAEWNRFTVSSQYFLQHKYIFQLILKTSAIFSGSHPRWTLNV